MRKKSTRTEEENKAIHDCIESFRSVNEGIDMAFRIPAERDWADYLVKKYSLPSKINPEKTQLAMIIEFILTYNKSLKAQEGKIPFGRIKKPSELVRHMEDLMFLKRKADLDLNHKRHLKEVEKLEKENYEKQKQIIEELTEEEKEKRKVELKEKMDAIKKKIRGF